MYLNIISEADLELDTLEYAMTIVHPRRLQEFWRFSLNDIDNIDTVTGGIVELFHAIEVRVILGARGANNPAAAQIQWS